MDLELLKYPIGKFKAPESISDDQLNQWIAVIKRFPDKISTEVKDLSDHELSFHYRPEGWTIRQVVHHCADSHMNAVIRMKLALTENNPKILPYNQTEWANLPDVANTPLSDSLNILNGLHARFYCLLSHMDKKDFERSYFHPAHNRSIKLREFTGSYAWHCEHHLAHIRQAIHYQGRF